MAAADSATKPADQVLQVRRNPWVLAAASLPFGICVASIIGAAAIHPALVVGAIYSLAIGAVTTRYAWLRNPWPRVRPQKLCIDGEGLTLGREIHRRVDFTTGLLTPSADFTVVRINRRGLRPALELRVADEQVGHGLLKKLGLSASQIRASFRTLSRIHSSWQRLTAGVFGPSAAAGLLAIGLSPLLGPLAVEATVVVALILLVTLWFAPTRVEVGADGVVLRWLGTARFLAHDEIVAASISTMGHSSGRRSIVCIDLTSGEEVVIPTGSASLNVGRAKALKDRILQARAACQSDESSHAEALVRRGGRSHLEWVRALQTSEAQASHRRALVPKVRLWRIVEDPTAEPLTRAVAAASLGRGLDAGERARVKRAAEATVAPRLRVALDAIARQAEDESVAQALAVLENDPPGVGQRVRSR